MTIVELEQHVLSPYMLQRQPLPFAELLDAARTGTLSTARIKDVDEREGPWRGSIWWAADDRGFTTIYKQNIDSGG